MRSLTGGNYGNRRNHTYCTNAPMPPLKGHTQNGKNQSSINEPTFTKPSPF